jgi:hypothetical protein
MTPPPVTTPQPPSQGLATASLICGILTLPTCWATFIPAIVTGHIAWSRSAGAPVRANRAKIGLIIAYVSLALLPVIAALAGLTAPMVIRQRDKADLNEVISNSRQLALALIEYQTENKSYPPDLETLENQSLVTNLDRFLTVSKRHPGNWTYHPNANPEDSSATLLVSPRIRDRYAVVTVDGAVRALPPPPPPPPRTKKKKKKKKKKNK